MRIWGKITGMRSKTEDKVYRCWMCDEGHDNPTTYLWHIHAHKLEMEGQRASAAERTLEVSPIISR